MRCFTRGGHDWADSFPAIVEAARRLKASSFLIDREAIICRADGLSDFEALRVGRRAHEVMLVAFDLIELQGDDFECGQDVAIRFFMLHQERFMRAKPRAPFAGPEQSKELRRALAEGDQDTIQFL